MDDALRLKTQDEMAALVESAAEHVAKVWEDLSEEDRANVPPEVRARMLALLERAEEIAGPDA